MLRTIATVGRRCKKLALNSQASAPKKIAFCRFAGASADKINFTDMDGRVILGFHQYLGKHGGGGGFAVSAPRVLNGYFRQCPSDIAALEIPSRSISTRSGLSAKWRWYKSPDPRRGRFPLTDGDGTCNSSRRWRVAYAFPDCPAG